MGRKHHTIILGDGNIRIDISITTDKGRVKTFSVNLSVLVDDKRIDVVRWDTSHGYLHKHEFWRTHRCIKDRRYGGMPLEIVLDRVKEDVKRNWAKYAKKMLEYEKKNNIIKN